MKFFKLPEKELKYMATLDWNPLMKYLENKYGVEYRDQVAKRLSNTIQKTRDEKQHSKIMSITDDLKEKLK